MTNTETLEGFQLSQQQMQRWQIQARDPSPAYRCSVAIEIGGPLDAHALRGALDSIVSRHEILRTTFRRLPGMAIPVQVIAEPSAMDFKEDSASNRQTSQRYQLDNENGPVICASLHRLSSERHLLAIEASNLCSDARTLSNLTEEMARTYFGDTAPDENSAPMQYADYGAWQTETTRGAAANDAAKFWGQLDRSLLEQLTLPSEKKGAGAPTFEPRMESIQIEAATLQALTRLAEEQDCQLSDLLLGAWLILLARLSQSANIGIAVGFDGRTMPELNEAAGPYARFLPVVGQVDEMMPVNRFVDELKNTLRRAYAWQEYFAAEKVESVANTPATVSPVAFDYLEVPPAIAARDLSFRVVSLSDCSERFRFKLVCVRRANSLIAELHYDPAACDPGAAQRLLEEFSTVIGGLSERWSCKVSELPIMGPKEFQLVTEQFNGAGAPIPDVCIHALIEAAVQDHASSPAVVCGTKKINYRELNLRANDLAATLQKHGVEPETPVGLCIDRSVEMLVAILGILKAGGCYVPLDPSYPAERLRVMLADCGARVLLTCSGLRPVEFSGQTLYLDESRQSQDEPRLGIPIDKARPENTAYIIYTSGSTGKPKGVPITHRNLVHSTTARMSYYQQPVASYLLLSSFAFDSSVAGIFWTLCQGGMLVIPLDQAHQDPAEINKLISQHQVTHLLCLPSLYRHLLGTPAAGLSSLRVAIVAGESCQAETVAMHRRTLPGVKLYNEYGPTEATVWSTVFDCSANQPARSSVPIGKPITNARVYVLDASRRPAPVQVAGEIHLGGVGIASGYWNRPELTLEKFIADPFKPQPDGRLYRTGDLGRFLPDGNLEFMGRIDQQVKIRGYRVELEEVEAQLRQHPGVLEAIVLAEAPPARREEAEPERLAAALEEVDFAEQLLLEVEERKLPAVAGPIEKPNGNEALHRPGATGLPGRTESPGAADRWIQRRPDFDVTLEIKQSGFIQPPRPAQRQWLINRALAELSEDLETLHGLAQRFVPGIEMGPEIFKTDRTQGLLKNDEIIQDWHRPLMQRMAEALNVCGREVLEIGFGRGMAAAFLQASKPRSHTIIECNDFVIENHFAPWRQQRNGDDIRLVKGKWQDVIAALPVFDAIFFQTYPLNETEFFEYLAHSITFAEHFFPAAIEHLRPGGALTYLSHEMDSLSRRHQRLLFRYFSSFEVQVQPLKLPENCQDLWWADSMVVIKAVK